MHTPPLASSSACRRSGAMTAVLLTTHQIAHMLLIERMPQALAVSVLPRALGFARHNRISKKHQQQLGYCPVPRLRDLTWQMSARQSRACLEAHWPGGSFLSFHFPCLAGTATVWCILLCAGNAPAS